MMSILVKFNNWKISDVSNLFSVNSIYLVTNLPKDICGIIDKYILKSRLILIEAYDIYGIVNGIDVRFDGGIKELNKIISNVEKRVKCTVTDYYQIQFDNYEYSNIANFDYLNRVNTCLYIDDVIYLKKKYGIYYIYVSKYGYKCGKKYTNTFSENDSEKLCNSAKDEDIKYIIYDFELRKVVRKII